MKPETLHAMCIKKRRYGNYARAEKAINRAWNDRKVRLRTYLCPVCLGTHLTHDGVEQPVPPAKIAAPKAAPERPKKISKTAIRRKELAERYRSEHPDWTVTQIKIAVGKAVHREMVAAWANGPSRQSSQPNL